MGIRLISRQIIQKAVAANTDRVVGFLPMPDGAKLNNAWIDMHVVASAGWSYKYVFHYGVQGMVIQVLNPDSTMTWEAVWDEQASKDSEYGHSTAFDSADMDTELTPSEIEYEPGLVDVNEMIGVDQSQNVELFKRRKTISFASSPIGWDPASGGTYVPVDHWQTRLKGGPTARGASVAIIGFTSPAMDVKNTVAATETMPSENEWLIFQFIDVFLEDMFKYLIGSGPGSATDPYQDAQFAITNLLEASTWEPDNDNLQAGTMEVTSEVTWDVTMPGMGNVGTLSSE